MSLATPAVQEVADNIVGQVESSLSQTIPFLPKAFTRVLAKAFAAVFILVYKYAGFMLLQQFVAHATLQETVVNGKVVRPLVEWGRLIGVGDPEAATRAELTVNVSVLVQTGSLAAGSQLLYPATGVLYVTTAAVLLNAPTIPVNIRASSDQGGGGGEGSIGNLEPGDIVQFANPLANVARNAAVVSQAVTGADGETPEAYRAKVIRRFQRKPQGGAYADYQQWGESVAGILNVYPYTNDPGTVVVYVEATVASSGSPDGIPTLAQRNAVLAAINADESGLATNRPANAFVTAEPITRLAFDLRIAGLAATDVPAAEDAIETAVDEHLRSLEPFIVGLSVLPRRDRVTRASVSGIADDAVSAVGGTITTVELLYSGSPIEAFTLDNGQKAKLGAITYL